MENPRSIEPDSDQIGAAPSTGAWPTVDSSTPMHEALEEERRLSPIELALLLADDNF